MNGGNEMVQKQITFCGEETELDCMNRTGLFMRLNPKSKQEVEDCINPLYRKAVGGNARENGKMPEKPLNEFE